MLKFIQTASEKTKKVYNMLGDYPETIAAIAIPRMIKNTKKTAPPKTALNTQPTP